jgi:S1-C subfamily serine protease
MSTYRDYDRPEPRYPYGRPPAPASGGWALILPFALLLLALLVLVGGMLLWQGWSRRGSPGNGLQPNAKPREIEARGDLSDLEKTNIDIYERTSPCLAHVTNLAAQGNSFSLNVQQVPKGTGSGFVWDQDGHVVTNYHVVEGADALRVTLSDHSTYDAAQVWAYADKDIAVIWIRAPKEKFHPIPLGTSHDLKVGQITYALGDPFGLDQSLTTGIVSALDREIESATERPIHGVIQTSAAINPGNSGGPLLDSAGRLIGMNTAILSPSGTFAGIGFAIPVDEVNRVVPQLIRSGRMSKPSIGVQVATDQLAEELGQEGALVMRVLPGSPAEKAGLQPTRRSADGRIRLGDVIVAVDGQPVEKAQDLFDLLGKHQPGETVTLTVERDRQKMDVKVTLDGGR